MAARRPGFSRRVFLSASTAGAGGAALLGGCGGAPRATAPDDPFAVDVSPGSPAAKIDLAPARWLWYPSQRCLANTFVLFRREVELPAAPRRAAGWVSADSRYLLSVNGARVQWGPAPADPRWPDVDPVDLTAFLRPGPNAIGATVLFYGHGDGTWPAGKPGFIFRLEIEHADGRKETVVSDATWQAHWARAWKAGQYKRWYLRSLQEDFDARSYPFGWDAPGFRPDAAWLPAAAIDCPPDKPASSSGYSDYAYDTRADRRIGFLRRRQIPALREVEVPAARLADSFRLRWKRPPEEYFDVRTPGSFEIEPGGAAVPAGEGAWRVGPTDGRAAALTFEFQEHLVGWPFFTIEAPAGTVVEVMVQESHAPDGPRWLDTHFYSWSRFTCREGVNRFEAFDYESFRWVQLHIRGAAKDVTVRGVGARRRLFPWPNDPEIHVSEPPLRKLLGASVNTLHNCAQETLVDGMGRERQQYSGDCGHQILALYLAFGETRLPARYLRTFSEGMTLDGYFLDCWPAYDRLARLAQRQLGMTRWGPLLDHGVGLNFDCWNHYLFTGDLEGVREPYPRLLRFLRYLKSIVRGDGLLPVEDLGVPAVWIDHDAYRQQRHKRCAFNLYAAAMLRHALAPLARALGDAASAGEAEAFGRRLLEATVEAYWDAGRGLFVNNRPWAEAERGIRLCDRSLATAVLFDQCPGGRTGAGLRALAECPPEMGLSYPANAGWRLWALARGGRIDAVLSDLRKRWASLPSVLLNNTLQEGWNARPDTADEWSHCPVVPLYVTYMDIAGIRPVEPGFRRCEIRPQLGDLGELKLTARTVRGPIRFSGTGTPERRRYGIALPEGMEGTVLFPEGVEVALPRAAEAAPEGLARYALPAGRAAEFEAKAR